MSDDHDDIDPVRERLSVQAAMGCEESRLLMTRRSLLGITAGLFSAAFLPRGAEAAGEADPRMLMVILRGGMDGLSTVVPHGDLHYISSRGELSILPSSVIPLDSFFGLHPALKTFGSMYNAGDAAIVHAVAPPLRTRSHFDCQDNLESGLPGRSRTATGWLNRLLGALPTGTPVKTQGAIEIGDAPLILRGKVPVLGWSPDPLNPVTDPTRYLIRTLYRTADKQLSALLESGLATQRYVASLGKDSEDATALQKSFRSAGRMLANPQGPRVAVMSINGWDTHTGQGGVDGVLGDRLGELDNGLANFRTTIGDAWARTVVVMVTEFGRMVGNNGNKGSDHGVGTVALLAGGAVKGGKIHTDWPGLAPADLYDGRDLKPTTDIRAMFKGLLREHLAVPDTIINGTVFPSSLGIAPLQGLIKGA